MLNTLNIDLVRSSPSPVSTNYACNFPLIENIFDLCPELIEWKIILMLSQKSIIDHVSIMNLYAILELAGHCSDII